MKHLELMTSEDQIAWLKTKIVEQDALLAGYSEMTDVHSDHPLLKNAIASEKAIRDKCQEKLAELETEE